MFYSIKELVEQADLDFNGNVAELMICDRVRIDRSRKRRSFTSDESES